MNPEEEIRADDSSLNEIPLTEILEQEFRNVLKCGIYKELYKKKMLTDRQLTELLNRYDRQKTSGTQLD